MTPRRRLLALAAAALLGACSEQLETPVECPALCPGGQPQLRDTSIVAQFQRDSSYVGYVERGEGVAMLVSNGMPAADARAVLRLNARPATVTVRDTARTYVVDSVRIQVGVTARDTAVRGIQLRAFRIPRTTTTLATFAEVTAADQPANLVATLPLADTLRRGTTSVTLSGPALAAMGIAPADSGIVALAFALAAPAPTGVSLAAPPIGGTLAPLVTWFVTANGVTDAALRSQLIPVSGALGWWVAAPGAAAPPGTLGVGGLPAQRAFIRFRLPPVIRDSATIVRATLELYPVRPITGLRNEPNTMDTRPIISDLGPKSPGVQGAVVATVLPTAGAATDTLRIEVFNFARFWLGTAGVPPVLALQMQGEGSTWTWPAFGSTVSGSPPRLRITYLRRFPFEQP
ncbi:MAG: hypothetical protein NW201_03630 [Gemmatimonadales bacterium]|nr:hypothetical protein [Gemmatimonadales bacterium]